MAIATVKKVKDDVVDDFNDLVDASLEQFQRLKPGQVVNGIVIEKEGSSVLIVDVGAKSEGVISGRELKTTLIDVNKIQVGEEIMVYVITPESRTGELMLSLRRTEEIRVWLDLEQAQRNSENIKAVIVEANAGGALVTLSAGVRGFIPTTHLDPARIFEGGQRVSGKDISSIIKKKLTGLIGQEVEARIIELDRKKSRIILSEKQAIMANSGQKILTVQDITIGEDLDGQVSAITPFGIFVNASGVEGLVHLSELSWDKVTDVSELYKVGDNVKVRVLQINDNGKRVAYSVKQLTDDPWLQMIRQYTVGDIVDGIVEKIVDYGAFIRIDKGINGLIHISELSEKLVHNPRDLLVDGQKIKVMILSISENERHLGLSLKRVKQK